MALIIYSAILNSLCVGAIGDEHSLLFRFPTVVDEQPNYKRRLRRCRHFNGEVQREAVVVPATHRSITISTVMATVQLNEGSIEKSTHLFLGQRGGGWSARGGASGDAQFSGGYSQQQQPYAMADPYAQQYSQMGYQGQQQIVNEYAGMDHSGIYGGRGRGGRGGRGGGGGRRPR